MATLNTTEYLDYFEDIATRLKALSHNVDSDRHAFFVEQDFFPRVKDEAKYPCLVVEYPVITPQDNDADNYRELQRGAFIVWAQYEPEDLPRSKYKAYDEAKAIVNSILSQMYKDDATLGTTIANMFDIAALEPYQSMEMPEDRLAGWRVIFTLNAHLDLTYTAADWNAR